MKITEAPKYRTDIDGLRAIAVVAVIIFHIGFIPNGFLGVDMFFVISGYLITGIIYREWSEGRFSILNFYERRIRRIIPLVTFICLVALVLGIWVMLPDDLENLSQSIIATNLFSNNILQAITTRNYWDIVNEFKPLMHTWSLAIEEQYYFLYPFLFLLLSKKRINWLLPTLIGLAVISLVLYLMPFKEHVKFYYLPFRFFELACGGILSIVLGKKVVSYKLSFLPIVFIFGLFFFDLSMFPAEILVVLTVLVSGIILITNNSANKLSKFVLENKLFIFIGRISFSLYMWHQLIYAFGRYFVYESIEGWPVIWLTILTIVLSVFTYYVIEQPFRNRHNIKLRSVLITLGVAFVIMNGISLKLYLDSGVFKDVPELGITKDNVTRNMHAQYNDRVFEYIREFDHDKKFHVLVLGNSFARDWTNVLLESKYASQIDISYVYSETEYPDKVLRLSTEADVVFYSTASKQVVHELKIPLEKVWCIGTKNFGTNNGIYYNAPEEGYCNQRTSVTENVLEKSKALSEEWGDRYIDLIKMVADEDGKVPVFSDKCMFMSQDCRHLTKAGAEAYAAIINQDPNFVLAQMLNQNR